MENPEEILHSLEEFSKMKPKDIPRELEEYLCFVAKTGDPVYQWSSIKNLFREKLINVITEFYEACPAMDIPPCPNVEMFNYDLMKNFIIEKLETFSAAPFTLQRICELLTTPRKEYNRIDKFMRALEKNILVVSTVEPGGRRSAENGEGIMNGIESEHVPEPGNEINIEEMDESPAWTESQVSFQNRIEQTIDLQNSNSSQVFDNLRNSSEASTSNQEGVISCSVVDQQYVAIETVSAEMQEHKEGDTKETDTLLTLTSISVEETITQVSGAGEIQEEKEMVEESEQSIVAPPKTELENETPNVELIGDTIKTVPEEKEKDTESKIVSETAGIENISPESSTSSPETLNEDVQPKQAEVACPVTSDMPESAEKEEVCEKKTEDEEITEDSNSPKPNDESVNISENVEREVQAPEVRPDDKIPENLEEGNSIVEELSETPSETDSEIKINIDENELKEKDAQMDVDCEVEKEEPASSAQDEPEKHSDDAV